MQTTTKLALAGVATLVLWVAAPADARTDRSCNDPHLSLDQQAACDRLSRGDRHKIRFLERLRKRNRPPVAELRLARTFDGQTVLPGRADLYGGDSTDQDGFIAYYDFQLFDDDTGMPLGSLKTTREPVTTIHVPQGLPPNLLAVLTVTDNLGATDTTELAFTSDGTVQDLPETAAEETEQ
jgi:hypothetical protein